MQACLLIEISRQAILAVQLRQSVPFIKSITIFSSGDQVALPGLSSIMLITSLMICLFVLLPAKENRIFNLVVGMIMTLMQALLTYVAGFYFYKMYAAIEAMLTAYIVWSAWNWPKASIANNLIK